MNTSQKAILELQHEGFGCFIYYYGTKYYFYIEDEIIGELEDELYNVNVDWLTKNLNTNIFDDKELFLKKLEYKIHCWSRGFYSFNAEDLEIQYGFDLAIKLQEKIENLINNDEYVGEFYGMDNFRIAEIGNFEEEKIYNRLRSNGCCGFYDNVVELNDRKFKFGFNYGH